MVKPEQDATIDYYALLEISIRASSDEIKKQYRKLALVYHPDRNRGREQVTVEKFQLLQQAHEVLSDPSKRAIYDRTRGVSRSTPLYKPGNSSPGGTPKTRYPRHNTTNGFSRTSPSKQRSAFGHFTTKEPPWSARRPPAPSSAKPAPTSTRTTDPRPSTERERADAYFNRFKERTNPGSSPKKPAFSQPMKGNTVPTGKSPKKPTHTRFGTTFSEDDASEEEDVFYSFSSNGGTFNGTGKNGTENAEAWSRRKTAYSHVFTGVKEDLRSPSKSNTQTTGFASDGFQRKESSTESSKKESQSNGVNGHKTEFDPLRDFNLGGDSPRKFSGTSPSKFGFGEGIGNENKQSGPRKIAIPRHPKDTSSTTPVREDSTSPPPDPKPPIFSFPTANGETNAPKDDPTGFSFDMPSTSSTKPTFNFRSTSAQRKTPQPQPTPEPERPLDPNEIPKTPPPVEDRRFAFAFSKLDVNKPTQPKTSPTKPPKPINIDEWTKKFEGMNPFMSPETKKLSEDKNFWSSVPLKPSPRKTRSGRPQSKKEDFANLNDLDQDLPKSGAQVRFESPGVTPVAHTFNINIPSEKKEKTFKFDIPKDAGISTPNQATQQPTPATTPFQPTQPPPSAPAESKSSNPVPKFNPPNPPKKLIPNPSNPKEFTFFVPPKEEMISLAAELQCYHASYVRERTNFEAAWQLYEQGLKFADEPSVRKYLESHALMMKTRSEAEALHTLCLERWGTVAKFAGFTG